MAHFIDHIWELGPPIMCIISATNEELHDSLGIEG
jgi:hypothetical protein